MIGYQELTYNLWDDHFKVMLYGTIRSDDFLQSRSHVGTGREPWERGWIFSATQRYNKIDTLRRIVATLFQHCNAVLQ